MPGPTDIVTILGKRGSGKSTLAWELAKLYPRLVVFDILGEHDEGNFDYVVHGFHEFGETIVKTENKKDFKILYRFDIESGAHDEEFNHALRVLYYRANVAILIEEVWNFCSKAYLPHWLKQAYLTGRHRGLAVLVTTQRPASLHKDILAQTNHFFSGTMFESNDVRYLSEFLGKDAAESLRTLPQYKFLHYVPGQVSTVVDNRA